ncbi:M23 family metallopeptidase [Alteriqipengyuania flavescens]|uniref:M23 family metallopeptidase n=1 Tax=Alteriqipengyuania flavescens TaxID=3053610 RepID=UPI0025B2D43B|nr:M23 family metallopeptidase [Alteriqipengyuania flavescens]WJY17677.1 M23 family metallopeptidase [Alteriqipengyuania flavescens]WJY23620.1 M23 family metallopeptidase [Alteriqipengyuania flavescens]
MAEDLSRVQQRQTGQDRITRNRSAMFRQQDTDAPRRNYQVDQRNASRADDTQALRDALGLAQRGAEGFQEFADAKFQRSEEIAGADGLVDGTTGQIDQERAARSRAYRENVGLGRAKREFTERLPDFDTGLKELIAGQTAADPEDRKAAVAEYVENFFLEFAVDEEGNVRSFESPAAQRWIAEQMASTRTSSLASANALIDEKMAEESVLDMTGTVRAQMLAGQDIEWDDALSTLLPTVDRRVAMGELVTTVKDVAATMVDQGQGENALRILDSLLGYSERAGGGSPDIPRAIETIDPGASDAQLASDFGSSAAGAEARAAQVPAKATYASPFDGFGTITRSSQFGAQRSSGPHSGDDYPVPVGTEFKAPLGGEVVKAWSSRRGGKQMRIKLDDGTILGIAHLSSQVLKEGDRFEAGSVVALSGNTGRSTGPHFHVTTTTPDGKKVSFSSYMEGKVGTEGPRSGGGGAAFDIPQGAAVDPSVLDPTLPSEAAKAAGGYLVDDPQGNLALSSQQRLSLQEFRRTLSNQVDRKFEQDLADSQQNATLGYISRMNGMGAYPTVTEVQEAIRDGTIRPDQGDRLISAMRQDFDRERAEVQRAEREVEQVGNEGREAQAENYIASILGPFYAGRLTPSEASSRLTDLLPGITDPEIRAAVLSGVTSELSKNVTLRQASPEYAEAADTLDRWQDVYVGLLPRRLPRGMTREQAARLIESKLDKVRVRMGRGHYDPKSLNLNGFEKAMDDWFAATFPSQ